MSQSVIRKPGPMIVRTKDFQTPSQQARIVREVLPPYLQKVYKMTPRKSQLLADQLAQGIVDFARRCGEGNAIFELPGRIMLVQPSDEECRDVAELIREFIVFEVSKGPGNENRPLLNHPRVKKAAGRLWRWLRIKIGRDDINPELGPIANSANIRG